MKQIGFWKEVRFRINFLLALSLLLSLIVSCQKEKFDDDNPDNGAIDSLNVPDNQGVTFKNNGRSAGFKLFAPEKNDIYLIGDFNNWQKEKEYAMKETPEGYWWIEIDGLDPSEEYGYQYLIDDTLRIADPYAHKILDEDNDQYIPEGVYPNLKSYPKGKTNEIVSVAQASFGEYSWQVPHFDRPEPENLVIYELLVRDFVEDHRFKSLVDTLDYVSRLGVNAIELMPVNEFEGNSSWGYNPNFLFALDKYYGQAQDYKSFVDEAHKKGIAVIQDIVLQDQFGSSPMVRMYATSSGSPTPDNPWFNTESKYPYAVGFHLNQQSEATQNYVKNVLKYWIKEYHIDGYRLDQSKAYTQKASSDDEAASAYDAGRIQTLIGYNNFIKEIDPSLYLILEHFTVDEEETELANSGMMLWNNLSYPAQQSGMGYEEGWDLSRMFYDTHGFDNSNGLVTYFESHDEERIQFKNEAYGNSAANYDVKKRSTGLKRDEMLAVFLFTVPGPKMFWQFGERGYDIELGDKERLAPKPPHWAYMQDPDRKELYKVYAKMIKMKTHNSIFTTADFEYDLAGKVKWINLRDKNGQEKVQVIANFDVVKQPVNIIFHQPGKWYGNFSKKTFEVPEDNPEKVFKMELQPGEYHLFSRDDFL